MAEQGYEYEQYAPQAGGRLFSSAMFGFNKEEVLEYLDELADENYAHQAASEQQIADLNQMVANLQASINDMQQAGYGQNYFAGENPQHTEELEIARAATQQAEGELAELREQLYNLQQENEWYRDAYQKNDAQIAELSRQLNEVTSGRWQDINETQKQLEEARRQLADQQQQAEARRQEAADLRAQLEKANAELATAQNEPEKKARESIIADAKAEADRVLAVAMDEKERIRRQIRTSAGGIAQSVTNLRTEVSGVENDVTSVLEAVQKAMTEVHSALGRTEQNLNTLGVQVERFPTPTPPVPKPAPQSLFFQQQPQAVPRPRKATAPESFGTGGFRRLEPTQRDTKARPFRPVTAPPAQKPLPPADEERIRSMAENLVSTLVDMIAER